MMSEAKIIALRQKVCKICEVKCKASVQLFYKYILQKEV